MGPSPAENSILKPSFGAALMVQVCFTLFIQQDTLEAGAAKAGWVAASTATLNNRDAGLRLILPILVVEADLHAAMAFLCCRALS